MRTTLALAIKCARSAVARELRDVLAPDNRVTPATQSLSCRISGSTLVFDVEDDRPGSALTTAISVLDDVSLYREVWLLSTEMKA